jgi:hypothetical protein
MSLSFKYYLVDNQLFSVLCIRIVVNADADQSVYLKADADPGSRTNADPDPGRQQRSKFLNAGADSALNSSLKNPNKNNI